VQVSSVVDTQWLLLPLLLLLLLLLLLMMMTLMMIVALIQLEVSWSRSQGKWWCCSWEVLLSQETSKMTTAASDPLGWNVCWGS
jgi:hypothetical protein